MNVNVFICCIYISPFLGTWELLSRCSSGAFHHPWCWHGTFCRRGSGSPTEWQGNPPNIAGSVALILNSNMCSKDRMNWHGPRYCWWHSVKIHQLYCYPHFADIPSIDTKPLPQHPPSRTSMARICQSTRSLGNIAVRSKAMLGISVLGPGLTNGCWEMRIGWLSCDWSRISGA